MALMTLPRLDESSVNDVHPAPADAVGMLHLLSQVPRYVRLVFAMVRDARVSLFDRLLVGASLVYALSPVDLLPDFVPILGQVDDLAFIAFALTRLFERADRDVIRSHWTGEPADLQPQRLRKLLLIASFFAGPQRRRRLRSLGGGAA